LNALSVHLLCTDSSEVLAVPQLSSTCCSAPAPVTRLLHRTAVSSHAHTPLLLRTATASLFGPGARVVLLVNNLGATPPLEMSIVAGEAVAAAEQHGVSGSRQQAAGSAQQTAGRGTREAMCSNS
jgi:hypothetical protein